MTLLLLWLNTDVNDIKLLSYWKTVQKNTKNYNNKEKSEESEEQWCDSEYVDGVQPSETRPRSDMGKRSRMVKFYSPLSLTPRIQQKGE